MTPAVNGKPLRFFLMLMMAWIGIRLASQPSPISLPTTLAQSSHAAAITSVRRPHAATINNAIRLVERGAAGISYVQPSHNLPQSAKARIVMKPAAGGAPVDPANFNAALTDRRHADNTTPDNPGSAQPHPLPFHSTITPDRWHGSAWTLWRPGGRDADIANLGRLGGSQAGLRIDYVLTPTSQSPATVYARATIALQRPASREAAIGLAFQPTRAIPISLAIERRIALGTGARNANAAMAVGGFGPTPVAPGLVAEGYAQTGIVGFNRRDAFIDGKISLLSRITGSPFKVGGALSGGAQPGVERIDIGPEVQLRLPLPMVPARIGLEWRERIVGRAAPASGFALTLAADF